MRALRFAITGTNFISDSFCDALAHTERASAVAIYSRTAARGAEFAKKHNIPRVYTDYAELLRDGDIDAVYIASPTFMHRELSIAALKAGRHVLCEKTIALNSRELCEMTETAERADCALIEAMRSDFDPAFAAVAQALPRLGKIRRAYFEFRQYSSRYDAFLSGNVMNAFNPTLKNSALSDIGIYPLHLCVRLFGEPTELSARSRFLHNGFEAEGELVLSYSSFDAEIRYSKIAEGKNVSFIEGENGTIRFGKINSPRFLSIEIGGRELASYEPEENNMRAEIDGFCDTVHDRGRRAELLELTERVMRVYDVVARAAGILYTL